jgi:hypothetical protein
VSATSSAQGHGGARRAKFRPPLLHPVPPGTNARADERSRPSPRVLKASIARPAALTPKHRVESRSLADGASAMTERRYRPIHGEKDGHAQ